MTSTALTRLTGSHRRLTLGLELPLDNDWGTGRLAADRQGGRLSGAGGCGSAVAPGQYARGGSAPCASAGGRCRW